VSCHSQVSSSTYYERPGLQRQQDQVQPDILPRMNVSTAEGIAFQERSPMPGNPPYRLEAANSQSAGVYSATVASALSKPDDSRLNASGSHAHVGAQSTDKEAQGRAAAARIETANYDTIDDMFRTKMDDPGPDAPIDIRRQFLETQLDSMIGRDVLGSLTILGGFRNRLSGGVRVIFVVSMDIRIVATETLISAGCYITTSSAVCIDTRTVFECKV
jgi:hypothetical protein